MLFKIECLLLLLIFPLILLSAQPKLPVASENIIFETEFKDKDVTADISEGSPDISLKLGKVILKDSPWGKALYCGKGGAKLRYEIAKNVEFWNKGTAILWFRPLDWSKVSLQHSRVFFFGVESSKGFLGVQVSSGPKSQNILERNIRILLLYFKHIPSTTMSINGPAAPGDNKWHMLAVTWSKNEIGLSLDGAPFALKKINGELKKEYFQCPSFSIGSDVGANYLLQMLRIYNCRLNNQDLKNIYKTKTELLRKKQ